MKSTVIIWEPAVCSRDTALAHASMWRDVTGDATTRTLPKRRPSVSHGWSYVRLTDACDLLTDAMRSTHRAGYWRIDAYSQREHRLMKQKVVEVGTADALLAEFLPGVRCGFEVFGHRRGFRIAVTHDDGVRETYVVMPISRRTFERQVSV